MSDLVDARGVPIAHNAPAKTAPGGIRRCGCGVVISANAEMCLRCVKVRQRHHEGAIIAELAKFAGPVLKEKIASLPAAQREAVESKVRDYIEDQADRFKPGR